MATTDTHFMAIFNKAESITKQMRQGSQAVLQQAKQTADRINQQADALDKEFRDLKLQLQLPGPSGVPAVPFSPPSTSKASTSKSTTTSKKSQKKKGKKRGSVTSTPAVTRSTNAPTTSPDGGQSLFGGDSDEGNNNRPELSVIEPIRSRNEISLAADVMEFTEESAGSSLAIEKNAVAPGTSSLVDNTSVVVSPAAASKTPKTRSKRVASTATATVVEHPTVDHPSSSVLVAAIKASSKRKLDPSALSTSTAPVPARELFIAELKLRKPHLKRLPKAYSEESKCPGCSMEVCNFEQHYTCQAYECAQDGFKTHCKFSYLTKHSHGAVFVDEEFEAMDRKENLMVCATCGDRFENSKEMMEHILEENHIGYTAKVD